MVITDDVSEWACWGVLWMVVERRPFYGAGFRCEEAALDYQEEGGPTRYHGRSRRAECSWPCFTTLHWGSRCDDDGRVCTHFDAAAGSSGAAVPMRERCSCGGVAHRMLE